MSEELADLVVELGAATAPDFALRDHVGQGFSVGPVAGHGVANACDGDDAADHEDSLVHTKG